MTGISFSGSVNLYWHKSNSLVGGQKRSLREPRWLPPFTRSGVTESASWTQGWYNIWLCTTDSNGAEMSKLISGDSSTSAWKNIHLDIYHYFSTLIIGLLVYLLSKIMSEEQTHLTFYGSMYFTNVRVIFAIKLNEVKQ